MPHPRYRSQTARLASFAAMTVVAATMGAAPTLAGTSWTDATGSFGTFSLPDEPKGSVGFDYSGSGGGTFSGRFVTIKCAGCGWELRGLWVEPSSGQKCSTAKGGFYYWGTVSWKFSGDYKSFKGAWGYCDGPATKSSHGSRN